MLLILKQRLLREPGWLQSRNILFLSIFFFFQNAHFYLGKPIEKKQIWGMNNSRLQKGCRKRELGCGPHARFTKKLQFRVLFLHFTLKIKPLAEQISPEAASSEGLLPLAVKSLLISVPRLCLCFTAANTREIWVCPSQTGTSKSGSERGQAASRE